MATQRAKVRMIVPSDRDAIIEMSQGIYSGYDYLGAQIDEWLVDPRRIMYGLEVDGKLVGFQCDTVMDGGKTIWLEGLRIHRDYQKLKLNEFFAKEADRIQYGTEQYKAAIRIRMSWSYHQNMFQKRIKNGSRILVWLKVLYLPRKGFAEYLDRAEKLIPMQNALFSRHVIPRNKCRIYI